MRTTTRTAIILALAFITAVVIPPDVRASDPYEPNDAPVIALPLVLSIWDPLVYSNLELPTEDDQDWFSFEGVEGTWVTITCVPRNGLDVELNIYYGDTLLLTLNDAGKNGIEEAAKVPIETGGVYYICVSRPASGDETDNAPEAYYQLSVTFHSDPYEINSFPDIAEYFIKTYDIVDDRQATVYDSYVLEKANIYQWTDVDCYRFWARGGDYISITCDIGDDFDAMMALSNNHYTLYRPVNEYTRGHDESLIDFRIPITDIYYISVSGTTTGALYPEGHYPPVKYDDFIYPAEYTLTLTIKEADSVTTSKITGTVRDILTGEPLGNVSVEAYRSDATGTRYFGGTDRTGTYTIDVEGQEGPFTVTADRQRYYKYFLRGIDATRGETAVADLALREKTGCTKTILLEAYTSTRDVYGGELDPKIEELLGDDFDYITLKYFVSDDLSVQAAASYRELLNKGMYSMTVDRFRFYDLSSFSMTYYESATLTEKVKERGTWLPAFDIGVGNTYNPADRTVDLDITLTPLIDLAENYRLNVVVSEDSLNYSQIAYVDYFETDVYPYYHNDVVREMVTGAFGEPLNDDLVQADILLQRNYTFTLPSECTAKNCYIVVFVHEDYEDGIGPVQQAVKVPVTGEGITAVEESVPRAFVISSPYPNPFNPSTTIGYELPEACRVTCAVYDILGRTVAILEDGYKSAGRHSAAWNGRDSAGNALASGVYFYRLSAGAISHHGKMMLVR